MMQSTGYATKGEPVVLANVLSDAGLNAIAKDVWLGQQTFVRQFDLAVGEQREVMTRAAVPQLGGTFLDLGVVLRREQDQPCPGATSATCSAFTMQVSPDLDTVREIVEGLPIRGGMPRITAFAMQTHAKLVCDAQSHAPYEYRVDRSAKVTFEGGIPAAEQNSRTYAYDYRTR
jgi:hypothetical protein